MSVEGVGNTNYSSYYGLSEAEGAAELSRLDEAMADYELPLKEKKELLEEVKNMIKEARNKKKDAGSRISQMSEKMVKFYEKHHLHYDLNQKDTWHSAPEWQTNINSLTNFKAKLENEIGQLYDKQFNIMVEKSNILIDSTSDLEAVIFNVLSERSQIMNGIVRDRVKEMSARNDKIQQKTNQLAGEKGKKKKNEEEITKIQGEIDKLSSDSQLDQINLQSFMNKLNQTIEMLTNLTQKFASSKDKIIGNLR